MDTVLVETEGFKALLTRKSLTIHTPDGGRVVLSGPDLETLLSVLKGRGVRSWRGFQ